MTEGIGRAKINQTTDVTQLIDNDEKKDDLSKQDQKGFKEMVASKVTLEAFLEIQKMLK